MKSRRRRFSSGVVIHCYQRTVNGFLIFYTVSDYLVFFTILCTFARKFNIRLLKVAAMPDHIHLSLMASNRNQLAEFMCRYTSLLSKENNLVSGNKGQLFCRPFGSAMKIGEKSIRTNFIYVDNNPVERFLTKRAELYRWNFVAYAQSSHPFSPKLVLSRASGALRRAISEVKSVHASGDYLNYRILQRMFGHIASKDEKAQLVDFIISLYNVIDYEEVISYFGSYGEMLTADHASKGAEHDIREYYVGKTDAVYSAMTRGVLETGRFKDIHEVLTLSADEKLEMYGLLCRKTSAHPDQVAKFLRIPRGGKEVDNENII